MLPAFTSTLIGVLIICVTTLDRSSNKGPDHTV